jgi:hypothetical protein
LKEALRVRNWFRLLRSHVKVLCMSGDEMMREDDLDDVSFQTRHVFALFGLASYAGQVLEAGLVNLLTLAQNTTTPKRRPARSIVTSKRTCA